MFLHVSVILFTGVVSQHAFQVVSQHTLQVSLGWYPSMLCRWYPSMPCRSPGGLQAHIQGGLQAHTQGGSPGPHLGGGGIPACTESDPPPDGYCRGRYASYWNTFLLKICLIFCYLLSSFYLRTFLRRKIVCCADTKLYLGT